MFMNEIKFIERLKLDVPVVEAYKKLRGLLKQYNFTESQVANSFNFPRDLLYARFNVEDEFNKLKVALKNYGFINHINETPTEVKNYIIDKLKEVDSEISLEGNTGYYGDRSAV